MTDKLDKLVNMLREELQQYGEMLALLEQQQDLVLDRAADGLMKTVAAINEQTAIIQHARNQRNAARHDLALSLSLPAETAFAELLPQMPHEYQLLVQALMDENNTAIRHIHQRARQNHLLLARSVSLMQAFINSLISVTRSETYNDKGYLTSATVTSHSLYEALG